MDLGRARAHVILGFTLDIGILPLIKNLKRGVPDITYPWYSDNARALGTFAILETYFDSLTRQGPGRGYHPQPTKSVLIVLPDNIEAGKVFGERHRFRVFMGARYLGGCIGDDESKCVWLRESSLTWEKNINTIRKTGGGVSLGELRRSGTYNPIRMDISSTHHLGHRRRVCGSEEYDSRNLFASYFLQKDENPISCRRSSKYHAGQ